MPSPTPLLSVLSRREQLLRRLETHPSRKSDLAERFGDSPSTIDRGLRELADQHLIERADGRYRPTLAGELALAEYERTTSRLTGIANAGDALAPLPADAPLDPAFLDSATVVTASQPSDRERSARTLERLIETADRHRVYAPEFLPDVVDAYRTAILDGLTAEIAVTSTVLDRLFAAHREALASALETGRLSIREAPSALPYTLVVSERPGTDTAVLLVFAGTTLHGVLYSQDDDALEWARATVAELWERAEPLSIAGGDD